jgi:nicotinamidase-related amidase
MEPIIIVDLQKAFPVPPKLVRQIEDYSRRFRKRVFTRFENPRGSLFRTALSMDSCAPGSSDTEFWIQPAKDDVAIVKRTYGLPPRAIGRLRALGVKRATVVGIDTDACVLAVMFSLFDAGIECRVNTDLCWSSSGLHREALKIIKTQFPPPKRLRK